MSSDGDERIQPALHALLTEDVDGLGALHFAVQFRRSEMVGHLLDRGASVAIHDANHNSDVAGWARACDDGSAAAASIKVLVGVDQTG